LSWSRSRRGAFTKGTQKRCDVAIAISMYHLL
jgi:hypothetical protein